MKIQEIISRIEAYHSFIPDYEKNPRACDGVKYGDPAGECTGIASAIDASVDVIRKAGQAGCNFLYVHEPTFYTHWDTTDWLAGDPVYRTKAELLDRYGMVVYRDHDHQHADDPDGVFQGIMEELGWQPYLVGDSRRPMDYCIPPCSALQLAELFKQKLGLSRLRVVGNAGAEVQRVSFVLHITDGGPDVQQEVTRKIMREHLDAVIPLECVEWTAASYVRDAAQLGRNIVMLLPGHMAGEALGNRWAVTWLRRLTEGKVPVRFIQMDELFQYI